MRNHAETNHQLCLFAYMVSNTYCVGFIFALFCCCLFSSCVPYVASFSRLSIFDCTFGIL